MDEGADTTGFALDDGWTVVHFCRRAPPWRFGQCFLTSQADKSRSFPL
jgi:hypothetical protein